MIREPDVVGIEEGNERGVSAINGGAAGSGRAGVPLEPNDLKREKRVPALGHLIGSIIGVVIGNDYAGRRKGLGGHRGERRIQGQRGIESRDYDGDGSVGGQGRQEVTLRAAISSPNSTQGKDWLLHSAIVGSEPPR